MSYDLSVYCPDTPSMERVLLLIDNTRGLSWNKGTGLFDEPSSGVLVQRGAKATYSFTVDGPFNVIREDLPDEVAAALPSASTLFQVLVEGNDESEIAHGIRFAKKLAKACHGVAFDEQRQEMWPKSGMGATDVSPSHQHGDVVEFAWYCLADELPEDLPEIYVNLAREYIPEALPIRFGSFYPYQGDFARDGIDGLKREWEGSAAATLVLKTALPVKSASLKYITDPLMGDVRVMSMTIQRSALESGEFRARTKDFFVQFAIEIGAFHAHAEVIPVLPNGFYADIFRYSSTTCTSPSARYQWVGLKAHPQWWMWFGPLYVDMIRPYLTGHVKEYPEGIFHSWTESPSDRRQLSSLLPGPAHAWIPNEYSGVYENDHTIEPTELAQNVPPRLREARMPVNTPNNLGE
ncbi:hypothetical protein LN996_01495 [Arthrobacter sp. AK01]|uniref:hypothetical protein n=1 Tax=Micrococcaceae TaxID=1268 RepID=UPI001E60BCD4|nr:MULTISPECIES: hypothetical protein [Micrococcaceae]MCD4849478.1 hypothetical protein [Arthrobacter sp. AK01]MCP1410978.1 hypothetical protein [Paenarthrobacter sp. A20]